MQVEGILAGTLNIYVWLGFARGANFGSTFACRRRDKMDNYRRCAELIKMGQVYVLSQAVRNDIRSDLFSQNEYSCFVDSPSMLIAQITNLFFSNTPPLHAVIFFVNSCLSLVLLASSLLSSPSHLYHRQRLP
jgi:hypothetical protein